MKISELRIAAHIAVVERDNPGVRLEYDRAVFANAVAVRVVKYREGHRLWQTALAKKLGVRRPAIARLEAGEHAPSLTMLSRLARGLDVDCSMNIVPVTLGRRESA